MAYFDALSMAALRACFSSSVFLGNENGNM
jgi:hypothetical protein